MKVIGIDPGLRFTGWGIVESSPDGPSYLGGGVLCPPVDMDKEKRLHFLYQDCLRVISDYSLDEAAFEKVFLGSSFSSALSLGEARGAALIAMAELKLPVFSYAPNFVKKTITGHGHADKKQVSNMLGHLLPDIDMDNIGPDASDAIAIALCHCICRLNAYDRQD